MNWTELNCPEQRPKETSSEAEKMRLIKTAAELIKSDLKSVEPGASTPYKRWSKCTMKKIGGERFLQELSLLRGGSA